MEITKQKISISVHVFNIKLYKNNQDIINTYILTSIIMKMKQDIIRIYILISYFMKINQDIISTYIFFYHTSNYLINNQLGVSN